MSNFIIAPGRIVTKVIITKSKSDPHDNTQLECVLIFDDGSQIEYIIQPKWSNIETKYLYCELEDDKYPFGIYEYKDNEYIIIENWDE